MSVTVGAELPARLRAVLEADPAVVVAYLFGSRATGRARPDSDVDVAVLLRDAGPDALPGLAAGLRRALAPLSVDIVDLAQVPVALAYRVLWDGIVVVDRDEGLRRAHWVRTVDQHLDMAPARRILREGTLRRLREGRFGRS